MIKYRTGKTGEFEHETNAGNPQKSRERERESNKPCGLISRICVSAIMLFIGTMVPFKVFSADLNNPEIQRLISEKQQKIAALEKCSRKVKGFKIAGISTIGLTAVGIAGNVALSNEREDVSQKLSNAKTTLAKQQAEQRQAEIDAAAKAALDDARAQEIASIKLDPDDIGNGYKYKSIDGSKVRSEINYKKCPEITENGNWCAVFDKYIVQGTSACVDDTIHGNDAEFTVAVYQNISPVQSDGQYCYCKMTSWTPDGGEKTETPNSSWMFWADRGDADDCAKNCAWFCVFIFYDGKSDLRKAVFGNYAK